jgi:hypothetical protein
MKRTRSRRVHPAAAVLILAASLAFVVRSVAGEWWDQGVAGSPAEPAAADLSDGRNTDVEPVGFDLLARHGSYEKGRGVRSAFALVVEAAAVPAGESAPLAPRRWTGADPPQLALGMVMVSAAARRAVLDGRVVGVGDQVGDCRIEAIERDRVRCRWQGQPLTYEIGERVPCEFRAEMALRAAESGGQATGVAPAGMPAPAAVDPGVDDKQAKDRGRR